ncbi:MAG: Crp/Fnr family transcriptional regulator [Clostridiales bacterium]|jgi:CRP-like cAMP-binding protein|nr:Crp/Fnr family transcriptional regulator [Clostridiales bacterium]
MIGVKNCPLFAGIAESDLKSLLACLSAKQRRYDKGNFIFSAGQRPGSVGIVLSGRVHLLKEDAWGNQNLFAEIGEGDLFAEAIVCAGVDKFPISAAAVENTETLWLDYKRVITSCTSACVFHTALIANMLRVLARKNILLVDKLEILSKRTTREKLLAYLSEQAKRNGSRAFDIPFNRQRLADYLSAERSALSAELSKMQADGLILFHKNHFQLLMPPDCSEDT